jgi:hypothetical protein
MEPEWLTYAEVADRLGVTPEAARSRAKRSGWRRQAGNDGRAKVLVALEPRPPGARPVTPRSPPDHKPVDAALVTALQNHINTLAAENEALKQDLTAIRADLSAHVETLKAQLASAEARAGDEAAKTARAIQAFADLADRLDQLAADRARPWWRRLVG